MQRAGRKVVTFQRRDVRSTNIEVNKRQRHDVSTSRRQRDFCLSIIKSKEGTIIPGIKDRTNEGTEIAATYILKKRPTFVFSSFRIEVLMFYRLNIYVLTFSMF